MPGFLDEERRRIVPAGGGGTIYDGADNASTTDAVPTMTSYTSPSGVVYTDKDYDQTLYTGWNLFADNIARTWFSVANPIPATIQYQFVSQQLINKYSIHVVHGTRGPKAWTFYGSNNGSDWDELGAESEQIGWANGEKRYFTFATGTYYTYFKLYITEKQADVYLYFYEIEFIAQAT